MSDAVNPFCTSEPNNPDGTRKCLERLAQAVKEGLPDAKDTAEHNLANTKISLKQEMNDAFDAARGVAEHNLANTKISLKEQFDDGVHRVRSDIDKLQAAVDDINQSLGLIYKRLTKLEGGDRA